MGNKKRNIINFNITFMSPFETTYEQEKSLFGNTKWICTIKDLEADTTYIGRGATKQEAREEAKRKYYDSRNEADIPSSHYDDTHSTSYRSSNDSWRWKSDLNSFIVGLIVFLAGFYLWQKNAYFFSKFVGTFFMFGGGFGGGISFLKFLIKIITTKRP